MINNYDSEILRLQEIYENIIKKLGLKPCPFRTAVIS